jgi:two-component system, chemotaxis family, sensor kinase CheA
MTTPEAEFLAIFHDEALERLDRIVGTLLAVEAGKASADAVDILFRDTHTIKGAASMVGLEEIGRLAHAMEDVLDAARDGGSLSPALVEILIRTADELRRHVEGTGGDVGELVEELGNTLAAGAPDVSAAELTPAEGVHEARRSIRVAPEKIDQLLDLVGETVLHRRRLEHVVHEPGAEAARELADELDHGGRLLDGLKDAAIGMRTLPLSSIVGPLPRAVRDLAIEAGKQAELVVEGADTELDRSILEGLSELLVHLLRNAVAHGLESPPERESLGKPAAGRVALHAEQRGGVVEVSVRDDGRGVSEHALAEARRTGSLVDVLARAGFSTAGEVTGIAGRGVGLDAVKSHVESFGGTIEVRSEPGAGTEVVLRLPLTLALVEVLLVERGDNVYGLPLGSVDQVASISDVQTLGGRSATDLQGAPVPVADLAALAGARAAPSPEGPPAVVVHAGGRRVALVCDSLLGKEEVIVKPLTRLLGSLPMYLGAALLGDGRIALLLDPSVLVDVSARPLVAPTHTAVEADGDPGPATVLVVEDSLAVRELQRSILEAAGYRVETARDGREALDRLGLGSAIGLVVTDVDMPELDGFGLTEAIRRDPTHASLPVVVVTSRGDEADMRRGLEAGADAYIVKSSFDQQDLLETVERLLGP